MFLLKQQTHRMLLEYDATFGHRYVPQLSARVPHERGGYLVRTNSMGFRSNSEFDTSSTRRRILIFGDSFTAGDGCYNEERFSDLVADDLDLDVFNFGLSGSAPDQHLLLFERFGPRISADLILWFISIHTIERIHLAHRASIDRATGRNVLVAKPYFEFEGQELMLRNSPVPRPRAPNSQEELAGSGEDIGPRPRSEHLYRHPRIQRLRRFANSYAEPGKFWLRGLAYRLSGVQLYEDYLDPESHGWQLMAALIRRFHLAARDTPVAIVPLPTYPYYANRIKPTYQPLYESLALPNAGLHVFDVTSQLASRPLRERNRFAFKTDGHFSPAGHRVLADVIGREIRSRDLLPAEHTTTASRDPAPHSPMPRRQPLVLGVSLDHHGTAAALIEGETVVAAAEQASFVGAARRHDFPYHAINYCLEEAGVQPNELAAVAWTPKLGEAFGQVFDSNLKDGSEDRWVRELLPWVHQYFDAMAQLRRTLAYRGPMFECGELLSRCTGTLFTSPFREAAVLVADTGWGNAHWAWSRNEGEMACKFGVIAISGLEPAKVLNAARSVCEAAGHPNELCIASAIPVPETIESEIVGQTSIERVSLSHSRLSLASAVGAAIEVARSKVAVDPDASDGGSTRDLSMAWGPAFSDHEIRGFLETHQYQYESIPPDELAVKIARLLCEGRSVARFTGRLEYGERSRGSRSLLRHPDVHSPSHSHNGARPISRSADEHALDSLSGILGAFEIQSGLDTLSEAPLTRADGEIACSPEDAYQIFLDGECDALCLGPYLLSRNTLERADRATRSDAQKPLDLGDTFIPRRLRRLHARRIAPRLEQLRATIHHSEFVPSSTASVERLESPEMNPPTRKSARSRARKLARGYTNRPSDGTFEEILAECLQLSVLCSDVSDEF